MVVFKDEQDVFSSDHEGSFYMKDNLVDEFYVADASTRSVSAYADSSDFFYRNGWSEYKHKAFEGYERKIWIRPMHPVTRKVVGLNVALLGSIRNIDVMSVRKHMNGEKNTYDLVLIGPKGEHYEIESVPSDFLKFE